MECDEMHKRRCERPIPVVDVRLAGDHDQAAGTINFDSFIQSLELPSAYP